MSTLYVLDWHRRTFGPQLPQFRTSNGTGDGISLKTGDYDSEVMAKIISDERLFKDDAEKWLRLVFGEGHLLDPNKLTNGPALTASCGHDQCQTYCCYDTEEKKKTQKVKCLSLWRNDWD